MAGGLPGTERIVCPRCRANNFPGAPRCWQCSASLPPPEALQDVGPSGMADIPHVPPPISRRPPTLAIVVAVLALVLMALSIVAVRRLSADRAERRMAELEALKQRLMQERGRLTPRGEASEDLDPTEEQARREIRRLERQLDQMPFGGGGGDVRLRTGGSMSAQEYERWRRELRRSAP